MVLILDTNALSAVAEAETAVMREFADAEHVAIPVIVLGEYRFGIAQSRHKTEYERWLTEMLSLSRVLEVNAETTRCYAEVRVELKRAGTPLPSNDVWIAALCRQHGLPILSRDEHFDSVAGLTRIGW